jgi:hypothetical protein
MFVRSIFEALIVKALSTKRRAAKECSNRHARRALNPWRHRAIKYKAGQCERNSGDPGRI